MTESTEFIETFIGIPPNGWTIGYAKIELRNGHKKPVEALRHAAFAIHEVNTGEGRKWRLTHAPTGRLIWSFLTMERAIECAERIEPFTAWSEMTTSPPFGSDLYQQVRPVIEDIHERATEDK